MNKIISVGMELEGSFVGNKTGNSRSAWLNQLAEKHHIHNFQIGEDGSVSVWGDNDCRDLLNIELRGWIEIENIERMFDFVKDCFENDFIQNSTCGNHLHFRFLNDNAALHTLSIQEVWNDFAYQYKKYSEFRTQKYLNRMSNYYCKTDSRSFENNWKGGDRYSGINITSYAEDHKTLEIRILPYAITAMEWIENAKWLIDTMNDLINSQRVLEYEQEFSKKELGTLVRLI
jgi:hypothetical protein